MRERDSPDAGSLEAAAEDFLYHLYRGSELLQDDRLVDAKVELELALALRPADPKAIELLEALSQRASVAQPSSPQAPGSAPTSATWRPPAPTPHPSPLPGSLTSLLHRIAAAPPYIERTLPAGPKPLADVLRSALVVFPQAPSPPSASAAIHASGALLVKAPEGFAVRAPLVRSLTTAAADIAASPLMRQRRGFTLDEPLGGAASPIVDVLGSVEIVLGPEPGRHLIALTLRDEPLFLREDLLAAFDRRINYENGRLRLEESGEGDAIPMIQLRGSGDLVASLPEGVLTVEVATGSRTVVRGLSVLGWTGRVVPRALPPAESVAGVKGLVALAGEGMVLLDGR